jgi:cell division protein FtsN
MFGGVVWLAYNEGVTRGRTETPVVVAANGPARVAPANPGGTDQPFKGFKIYEQPAPPDDDVAAPGTKAAASNTTAAAPEKVSPPPATKPAITATAEPAPPPASKPAAMAPAPAAQPAKPAPVIVGPATAPPRSLAMAPQAAPAAKPAAAPATQVAATGSVVLQIGAYKSQADADAAWKTYRAKHAALLDGYNSDVQQADLGDKGTWYRLRIAGFAGKDVASALCERLKADGGACFLGK